MESTQDTCQFKCVMVIDDTYADRYIAERTITKHRFSETVLLKESAVAALEYLQSVSDTPDKIPQLIFLDINMPEMNGFEFVDVYSQLSETIRKQCIIMMLTTSLNPGDLDRANNNPYVASFINKPLDKEKISQILASNQNLAT